MNIIVLNPTFIDHPETTIWMNPVIWIVFTLLLIGVFVILLELFWRQEEPAFSDEQEKRIREIVKEEKRKCE